MASAFIGDGASDPVLSLCAEVPDSFPPVEERDSGKGVFEGEIAFDVDRLRIRTAISARTAHTSTAATTAIPAMPAFGSAAFVFLVVDVSAGTLIGSGLATDDVFGVLVVFAGLAVKNRAGDLYSDSFLHCPTVILLAMAVDVPSVRVYTLRPVTLS